MVEYHLLADLVVIFHAAYVGFVVFGLVAILAGFAIGWEWVRNLTFRATHLAAIALVCVEALTGAMCPLTTLEDYLRQKGGETPYPGDFIGYWAHNLIFYDAPFWVFTVIYLIFGGLVVLVFILAPPRFRRASPRVDGEPAKGGVSIESANVRKEEHSNAPARRSD
jgi:hypothetical protein